MRIVSWNCQGAFRKKAQCITPLCPDIAVIQECEPLEKLTFPPEVQRPYCRYWFGDGKRGIGIFSYTNLDFRLHDVHDASIRHCIPLVVQGKRPLHLLAIWAMSDPNRRYSYIGQIHLAIQAYRKFIEAAETIIIGDFNSNSIWDQGTPKIGTHSDLVRELRDMGLSSIYHETLQEPHGKERINTFYLYRQRERGYHIDYCFTPTNWLEQLTHFSVGAYDEWIQWSDHCPLSIEFSARS